MTRSIARRRTGVLGLVVLSVTATGCGGGSPLPGGPATETEPQAAEARELRAAPARHTIDSDGHPIAVWQKGPAEPIGAIVLIHGRTWSTLPDFDLHVPGEELSLMDGLAERGYATFGVDLRGYGATPRDGTGWISPDRAVADVSHVLEFVWETMGRGERPVLFGWSLGSMVTHLTVQRHPDLVSAAILFGFPFPVDTGRPAVEDPPEPPREPTTAEAAASDFVVEGAISQAAIDAYVAAALAADPVRADWSHTDQWNAMDPSRITVPVLLLQGARDPLALTEYQVPFFTRLGTSDKQWVVVPGGDHAAFLETPREYFLDALVGFLERPR